MARIIVVIGRGMIEEVVSEGTTSADIIFVDREGEGDGFPSLYEHGQPEPDEVRFNELLAEAYRLRAEKLKMERSETES